MPNRGGFDAATGGCLSPPHCHYHTGAENWIENSQTTLHADAAKCTIDNEIWQQQTINNRTSSSSKDTSLNTDASCMTKLKKRESTYLNSSPEVRERKSVLARAGFYFTGRSDVVKCAFCNGEVHAWKLEENEMENHAKIFPKCRYALQEINKKTSKRSVTSDNNCDDHKGNLKETVEFLRTENARLHQSMVCVMCGQQPAQILMLPCRHLVSCSWCSASVTKCPKCEKHLERKIRIYRT